MEKIDLLLDKITSLLSILSSSFISQKYNNFQHYQKDYKDNDYIIIIPSKSSHSISISCDRIINASVFEASFIVKILDDEIKYNKGFSIEASTLIENDITIKLQPNTRITLIKQF